MEEQSVKGFADILPIVPLFAPESSIGGKMKRGPGKATEGEPAQKRAVTYETFKKWCTELGHEYQTVSWLDCDTVSEGRKKAVKRLRCSVCSKFKASIRGGRNFSERWIVSADSVCASNVKDHAQSDQHTHAMILLKRSKEELQSWGSLHMPSLRRQCRSCLQKRKGNSGRSLILPIL